MCVWFACFFILYMCEFWLCDLQWMIGLKSRKLRQLLRRKHRWSHSKKLHHQRWQLRPVSSPIDWRMIWNNRKPWWHRNVCRNCKVKPWRRRQQLRHPALSLVFVWFSRRRRSVHGICLLCCVVYSLLTLSDVGFRLTLSMLLVEVSLNLQKSVSINSRRLCILNQDWSILSW